MTDQCQKTQSTSRAPDHPQWPESEEAAGLERQTPGETDRPHDVLRQAAESHGPGHHPQTLRDPQDGQEGDGVGGEADDIQVEVLGVAQDEVFAEQGLSAARDRGVCQLAVETPEAALAAVLQERPEASTLQASGNETQRSELRPWRLQAYGNTRSAVIYKRMYYEQ